MATMLEDKIRQNPDAYNFDDIPLPPEALGSAAGAAEGMKAATLEELLGEYVPVKGKAGWFTRSPQLRQQMRILEITQGMEGVTAPKEILGIFVQLAEQVLCKRVGSDEYRRATSDEILDGFNFTEIQEVVKGQTGMELSEGADPQS